MNKRKKLIIFYVSVIVIMLVSVIYVSYGYMVTKMTGNETGKSFAALSQLLKIEYSDGTETLTSNSQGYFIPGSVITKTFTITNKGNVDLYYNILLDEVSNLFERKEDLEYELYLDNELISNDIFPKETKEYIGYSIKIGEGATQSFVLKIYYNNSTENQIIDKNKVITGKLSFEQTDSPLNKYMVYANSEYGEKLEFESGSIGNTLGLTFEEQKATNSSRIRMTSPFVVEKNKTYTIIAPITNTLGFRMYDENGLCTYSSSVGMSSKKYTFNSGENTSIAFNVVECTDINTKYEIYKEMSPDDPIEIKNMGNLITDENDENYGKYKVDFTAVGKNLFDEKLLAQEEGYNSYENGVWTTSNLGLYGRSILYNVYGINHAIDKDKVVKVKPNTKINIKFYDYVNNDIDATYTLYCSFYNSNGEQITYTAFNPNNVYTTNVPPNAYYLDFIRTTNSGTLSFSHIQIEEGTTATDYEPYAGITKSLYLDEPLRCIDSSSSVACDYIDLTSKNLVRNVKQITLNGGESWTDNDNALTNTYRASLSISDTLSGGSSIPVLSNKFKTILSGTSSNDTENIQISSKRIYVRTLRSRLNEESIDGFKEWITANNFDVYYPLATPTTTKLKDLPNLSSVIGKDVYLTDGTISSAKIELE